MSRSNYVRPGVVIDQPFEHVPLGHVPSNWVADPAPDSTIGTFKNKGPAPGARGPQNDPNRALHINHQEQAGQDYPSRLEVPLNIDEETVRFVFALRLSSNARLEIQTRFTLGTGPSLMLGAYEGFGAAVRRSTGPDAIAPPPQVLIAKADWDGTWSDPSPGEWEDDPELLESWLYVELSLTDLATASAACDVTVIRFNPDSHATVAAAHLLEPLPLADAAPPRSVMACAERRDARSHLRGTSHSAMPVLLEGLTFLVRSDGTDQRSFVHLDNVFVTVATVRTEPVSYINLKREIDQFSGLDLAERSINRIFDGNLDMYWHSGRRRVDVIVSFPHPVALSESQWIHRHDKKPHCSTTADWRTMTSRFRRTRTARPGTWSSASAATPADADATSFRTASLPAT